MEQKKNEVAGVLYQQLELNRCVAELRDAGFSAASISTYIAHPESKHPHTLFGKVKKNTGAETGVAGAGIGAALGSMLGFLFGSGYLDFFGTGASTPPSPYFSVAVGAAVGSIFGGIGGVLVGHKIPEEEDAFEQLAPNEILISVRTQSEEQIRTAKFILAEFGATQITPKDKTPPPFLIYQQKNKLKKASKRPSLMDHH